MTELNLYPNISTIFPSLLSTWGNRDPIQIYQGVANPVNWL
jgi:hypothetical protein